MKPNKFLKTTKDDPVDLDNIDYLNTKRIVDLLEIVIKNHSYWSSSFVIWLQWSRWSWKTSIIKTLNKNLINDKQVNIINFCPWLYWNHINVFNKFFDVLANWLWIQKNSDISKVKDKFLIYKYQKELSNDRIEKSEAFLSVLKHIPYNKRSYILWIFSIIIPFFKWIPMPEWMYAVLFVIEISLVSIFIRNFFKEEKERKLLSEIISNYRPIEELKTDVENLLDRMGTKLLVIIDDLDRLEAKKLWEIFQIIKSTWNFKNTIYILCYDKWIVEPMLDNHYWWKDYLWKIVQYEINLPKITKEDINSFFYSNIQNFVLEINNKYSTSYSINVVEYSKFKKFLWFYAWKEVFKTIRDVKRFFNELKADFSLLHSDFVEKEIDIVDFISIEIIKFSNLNLYNLIYEKFSYVFFYNNWFWTHEDLKAFYDDSFWEKYSEWLPLIFQLFPVNNQKKSTVTKRSNLSISNPDRFNDYFKMNISWFTNTEYNKLCYLLYSDGLKWKEYLYNMINTELCWSFLNLLDDKIETIDRFFNENEIRNIVTVLKELFVYNRKIRNRVSSYLRHNDFNFRISYLFDTLMTKLSFDVKLYEKVFMDVVSYLDLKNQIFHIVEYTHTNLNSDEEYLLRVIKDEAVVENIKSFQNKLKPMFVKRLFEVVKNLYLKKFEDNKIHEDINWNILFENGKDLGWISSYEIYDYSERNWLLSIIIENVRRKSFQFFSRSIHRESSHLKSIIFPYFDREEQLKIIKELDGFKYYWELYDIIMSED